MSTQRRRVLEGSKKLEIPADGVYIEDLEGKAYTVDEWQGGNDANSIIVASGDVKFRMSLTESPSDMHISSSHYDPLENYMTAISDLTEAKADYDGAGNTAKIMQMQPSTSYAAGYCNAFTFPDGKTKGYLPSFGQSDLAHQNKEVIGTALNKCGGTAMRTKGFYWTSTFYNVDWENYRSCWNLYWGGNNIHASSLGGTYHVRPFADIS